MIAPEFRNRTVAEVFDLTDRLILRKQVGNGRRTIAADTVTLTMAPCWRYLSFEGPTIRRDGSEGRRASVGWTVGANRGPDADVPAVVLELLAALDGAS